MKVQAVQCYKCKDIIWSRAGHDFRWCTCESVAIDGGRHYTKIIGDPGSYMLIDDYEVGITADEAHKDWNTSTDKYGLISLVKKEE
jgi:hypothetical protein